MKKDLDLNMYNKKDKRNLRDKVFLYDNNSIINEDKKTTVSSYDKDFYNKIENINIYLKQYYSKFFDNFELLNFINSGSTGRVFEGRLKNAKKNMKLAFKFKISQNIFRKNKKDSQEIAISKKLNHKNITAIYAYIKMSNNSNFSILELAKNGDLHHFEKILLKRKVLSESTICYFAKQILDALEYMHKCKIIHMDIKEGNILIDSNLNIKLSDFSVSCSYSEFNTKDNAKLPFAGTSKYMSPEIINRTNMDIKEFSKIDIYSLGVTLYNLAFGFYPYKLNDVKNKDYNNILNNIQKENIEFPKDRKVSDLFKDFLKGLLEKDYTKRFNIRQAINHPWIKGAEIIFDEKENAFCHENFLINLITDNIPKFNEYIKKNDEAY